jgi:hypothetical protein
MASIRLQVKRIIDDALNYFPLTVNSESNLSTGIVKDMFPDILHINVTDEQKLELDKRFQELFNGQWYDYSWKCIDGNVYKQQLVVYYKKVN